MEIELFEINGGWGFIIKNEGQVIVYQPTDDIAEGNDPMTKTRAEEYAQEIMGRLEANP